MIHRFFRQRIQLQDSSAAASTLRALTGDEELLVQTGDFWSAVTAAHKQGVIGRGRQVAIIDGNFDISLLCEHGINVEARGNTSDGDKIHGTAVALLLAKVAPDVRLLLYPTQQGTQLSKAAVIKSIDEAVAEGCDIINLSLGQPAKSRSIVDWLKSIYSRDHCAICAAARRALNAGVTVAAAAGNEFGEAWCPARMEGVASIGFMSVIRKLDPSGTSESAFAGLPNFKQSYELDWAPRQPPEALGTSFATPLYAGLAALVEDRAWLPAFIRFQKKAGSAETLQGTIRQGAKNISTQKVEILFREAFDALPHIHMGTATDGPPCVACSILAQSAYVNFGLHLLNTNQFELAEDFLVTALWLGEWSPEAAANLGALLRVRALSKDLETQQEDAKVYLKKSQQTYSHALNLRSGFTPYVIGLRETDETLANIEYKLGYIAFEEKLLDQAIYHFTESVRLNPSNIQSHVSLGMTCAKAENFEGAVHEFEYVLDHGVATPEILDRYARALLDLDRPKEAASAIEKLLAIDSSFEDAEILFLEASNRAVLLDQLANGERLEPFLTVFVQQGQSSLVAFLVRHGVDVNVTPTGYPYPPLLYATHFGYIAILLVLIEAGAKVDFQDSERHLSALMMAACQGHVKVVDLLLGHNAQVNLQDTFGFSSLMFAAERGHTDVAKLLIEKGANLDLLSQESMTAIDYAKRHSHCEIVNLLESAQPHDKEAKNPLNF
jgi:tetratricopeptide (TPR) repeat protein